MGASRFEQQLLATRLLDEGKLAAARAAVGDDDAALARYLVREGLLTRFQVRQVRAGATSFHVDKYVVVDCLGRGGNSVVYKARHVLLQRYVALKTLEATDLHNGDAALARFKREIDIVARLEHPNVVRAYDVIRTRTQIYQVLEYVDGRDLGALIRERGPVPVSEAIGYVIQAAQGLAYAHRCGIIHRDIKPGNLLLTRDGIVKLADLGLARFFVHGPEDDLSMIGACLGTPEFMAPEQAEDASRAETRSDLYSLGATLFHLLTAELPVTGSSQMLRLKKLLLSPVRPLAVARPDVPNELAALVDQLRERDPARRPATADEVVARLQALLRQVPSGNLQFDGRFQASLVLEVLQGRLNMDEACRRGGVEADEFERWRQTFVEGGRCALSPSSAPEDLSGKVRDLHTKIGLQAMEIEQLKRELAARQGVAKNGTLAH